MLRNLILLCILSTLFSCTPTPPGTFDILIENANIIDVKNGIVIEGKTIGIRNDTIQWIGSNSAKQPEARQKIDAKHQFVMPGLWDMHVHFRGGDALISENKNLLPLFLAHGVTTVRDAGGDMTPNLLKWKKDIAQGRLAGPRIFTSGPKLDGARPAWGGSIKITTVEDIAPALDSLQTLGADYVKIYDGSLSKELFYDILKEAEKRGLKTTGHMPLSADIQEAARLGLDGTEHTYYALKSTSKLKDSLTNSNAGYGMFGPILESYDPKLAQEVFEDLAKNEFYITPTQGILKILSDVATKDHSKDTLLPYIGEGIVATYQRRILGAKRAAARGARNRYNDLLVLSNQYIPAMHNAGILLLAGSDCGASNSYSYPGASLVDELSLLVSAGLTPQQALATSIVNGPRFFESENYYGSISKGKVADLLILRNNPLDDITQLNSLSTLVTKGSIYSKKELDAKITAIHSNR